MGKTYDEMTEEEKQEFSNNAYDILVQLWAEQNHCKVVRKENKH